MSLKNVGTFAIQSRDCTVLSNDKYIFTLSRSSRGVTDSLDGILRYQLEQL